MLDIKARYIDDKIGKIKKKTNNVVWLNLGAVKLGELLILPPSCTRQVLGVFIEIAQTRDINYR